MSRVLAWIGLCLTCSAMAAVWWPLGLLPALIVVALVFKLARR